MTENKRVVITGMGALSPIGNDAQTSWENALKGVNGIDTITRIDTEDYNVHLAGELKDFNVEDHIEKKEARRMDRFTQYAVVAARQAVEDAKLEINDETANRSFIIDFQFSIFNCLTCCHYRILCETIHTSSFFLFNMVFNIKIFKFTC